MPKYTREDLAVFISILETFDSQFLLSIAQKTNMDFFQSLVQYKLNYANQRYGIDINTLPSPLREKTLTSVLPEFLYSHFMPIALTLSPSFIASLLQVPPERRLRTLEMRFEYNDQDLMQFLLIVPTLGLRVSQFLVNKPIIPTDLQILFSHLPSDRYFEIFRMCSVPHLQSLYCLPSVTIRITALRTHLNRPRPPCMIPQPQVTAVEQPPAPPVANESLYGSVIGETLLSTPDKFDFAFEAEEKDLPPLFDLPSLNSSPEKPTPTAKNTKKSGVRLFEPKEEDDDDYCEQASKKRNTK